MNERSPTRLDNRNFLWALFVAGNSTLLVALPWLGVAGLGLGALRTAAGGAA